MEDKSCLLYTSWNGYRGRRTGRDPSGTVLPKGSYPGFCQGGDSLKHLISDD